MTQKEQDEYFFLTEKLEEIEWAIKGECNDIDCDKYMYKDLLKKRYKPVLEHNFSCMKSLKIEREALLRILSQNKYRKYKFIKCRICAKEIDKLGKEGEIVSFTRPSTYNNKKCSEWAGVWAHKICASKIKIPEGWKKI